MQVILLERVEKLGIIGDVVTVKPGYARNFLLPKGKALRANKANQEAFEARRGQIEADNVKQREEAEKLAGKMDDVIISMVRQASDAGALYGSVSPRDIATGVSEEGFTINKSQVILEKPIKLLGIHPVKLRLHPEVDVMIKVNVAKSMDEAEAQLANDGLVEDQSIIDALEEQMGEDEAPAEETANEQSEEA